MFSEPLSDSIPDLMKKRILQPISYKQRCLDFEHTFQPIGDAPMCSKVCAEILICYHHALQAGNIAAQIDNLKPILTLYKSIKEAIKVINFPITSSIYNSLHSEYP